MRLLHYTFELYLEIGFNRENEKYEGSVKFFQRQVARMINEKTMLVAKYF